MEAYRINKIEDGFWSIDDKHVRCFLLKGEKRSLLIDTGFGTGDLKKIVQELVGEVPMLAITHADGDHIGCNKNFGTTHMHPSEYANYHGGLCKGLPTVPLWEGDVIDLGGRLLEIVLIPGHTPGSIAFLDRENRFLIGGDSIQNGAIFMFGPARDMPAYLTSMQKLLSMKDLFDTVYASHADLSVDSNLLSALAQGAQEVLAGTITGTEPDKSHRNYGKCLLYQAGPVSFWY